MASEKQSGWPAVKGEPVGFFQSPDATLKSGRSVAGPLRTGTAKGVGPKGAPRSGATDFGMDRITPRGFDPMGTADSRAPAQEASELLSRQTRRSRK